MFDLKSTDVTLPSTFAINGQDVRFEDLVLTTRDRVTLRCYFLRATPPSLPGNRSSENIENQLDTQSSNEALDALQVANSQREPNRQVAGEAPDSSQAENEENQPTTRVSDEAQDTPQAENVKERATAQVRNEAQDTPQVEHAENQRNEQVRNEAQDITESRPVEFSVL